MTQREIPIAVFCGLLTAFLFAAPLGLGGLGFVLSTFTALPLFVVALGFGTRAALIAGAAAAIAVAIFANLLSAVALAGVTLLPAIIIGHSVGLVRTDDGVEEWFPLSGVLLRMIVLSIAMALLIGAVAGYDPVSAAEQVRTMLSGFGERSGDGAAQLSPEQIDTRVAQIVTALPYAVPVSFLLLLCINLWLGARIARRAGWMLRPHDHVSAELGLPLWAIGVLAAAALVSLAGGSLGLVGKVVAGAFGAGFALVGLATAHYLSRGLPGRTPMLVFGYFLLLVSRYFAVSLALLGVAETAFNLRARRSAPPPSNPPTTT